MARTIQQIFDEQKTEAVRLATEAGNTEMVEMFTNTSAFATWRIMFYIMAFSCWSLEVVQDNFVTLVNGIIAKLTPHHSRWYQSSALAFQYGFAFDIETGKFDNTGKTADEIAASKIIKYAAVNATVVDDVRVLLIKIAGVDGSGNLVPLPLIQFNAFKAYMEVWKDSGVPLIFYNRVADLLRCEIDVYFDPLLLDEVGNRLDGLAGKPVEVAAKAFLLTLPFNGEFSNAAFVDYVQNAYGVKDRNVFLKGMLRGLTGGLFGSVNNSFIPDAGYATFDVLTINYVKHV